jgi:hypothetical protein
MLKRPVLAQALPAPLLVNGLTIGELLASKREQFGGARMGPDDDKTFTQDDVNRLTAEARDRGKREAATGASEEAKREAHRDFLKAAGLPEDTKPEDVGKALKAARDKELEQLGEVERAKREADDAKAELQRERDSAAQRETERAAEQFEERLTNLIEKAGAGAQHEQDADKKAKEVARVRKLLSVDVKVGADSDAIRKAIDEVKVEYPELFPTGDGEGGGLPDGRPGSGPGTQRQAPKSKVAEGKAKAIAIGWTKPDAQAS